MIPTDKRPALALALFCALAMPLGHAQDPTPPKADGEGAAEAPPLEEAEKRVVTPEAKAILEKAQKLVHTPTAGVESLTAVGKVTIQMFGGDVAVKPLWKKDGGFKVEVGLPASAAEEGAPPEMVQQMTTMAGKIFEITLGPVFEGPLDLAKPYHARHRERNGEIAVELLPFEDDTNWERVLLYPDPDGRIERSVGLPRLDTTDPSFAMIQGVEFEIEPTYTEMDEQQVLTRVYIPMPEFGGALDATIEYYEPIDGRRLPKLVTAATPFDMTPYEMKFADYAIDGKKVAATASKAVTGETKNAPEESAGKPAEGETPAPAEGE